MGGAGGGEPSQGRLQVQGPRQGRTQFVRREVVGKLFKMVVVERRGQSEKFVFHSNFNGEPGKFFQQGIWHDLISSSGAVPSLMDEGCVIEAKIRSKELRWEELVLFQGRDDGSQVKVWEQGFRFWFEQLERWQPIEFCSFFFFFNFILFLNFT